MHGIQKTEVSERLLAKIEQVIAITGEAIIRLRTTYQAAETEWQDEKYLELGAHLNGIVDALHRQLNEIDAVRRDFVCFLHRKQQN